MNAKGNIEWTEAHREEALRWLCHAYAELPAPHFPIAIDFNDIASEHGFRRAIVREIDIDAEERAVRRVDALATGRLVRETDRAYRVRKGGNFDRGDFVATPSGKQAAKDYRDAHWPEARIVPVRFTRIRRAT